MSEQHPPVLETGRAAGSDALNQAVDRLARAVARLDAATRQPGEPAAALAGRVNAAPVSREELAQRLDAALARLKAVLDA